MAALNWAKQKLQRRFASDENIQTISYQFYKLRFEIRQSKTTTVSRRSLSFPTSEENKLYRKTADNNNTSL